MPHDLIHEVFWQFVINGISDQLTSDIMAEAVEELARIIGDIGSKELQERFVVVGIIPLIFVKKKGALKNWIAALRSQ